MKRILIWIIRIYQKGISPHTTPCCRFTPTCSQYAVEVIGKFGAVKGGYLAFRRILRCHPFHSGGMDLVPETFHWRLKPRSQFNKTWKNKAGPEE